MLKNSVITGLVLVMVAVAIATAPLQPVQASHTMTNEESLAQVAAGKIGVEVNDRTGVVTLRNNSGHALTFKAASFIACGSWDPATQKLHDETDVVFVPSGSSATRVVKIPDKNYQFDVWFGGSTWTPGLWGTLVSTPAGFCTDTSKLTNNASCVAMTAPDEVFVGQSFTASVTMKNTGTKPWTTDSTPHRLGSQAPQDTHRWDIARIDLPTSPVQPGQNATFSFQATAPSTASNKPLAFNWRMVEEDFEWFPVAGECSTAISVVNKETTTPTPTTPTPTPTPAPVVVAAAETTVVNNITNNNTNTSKSESNNTNTNTIKIASAKVASAKIEAKVTPAPKVIYPSYAPVAVPVTAKTGVGLISLASLSTITGLVWTARRFLA